MNDFGSLQSLSMRSIWKHEAAEFTPWLCGHVSELGEALGMDLELVSREAGVGDFSLDILARDLGSGRHVIIENQVTATDHDHLGKLLTYAAGYDAAAVVWVAESMRDEHRRALEWLNERTDESAHFFGVIVEVLQIDDSRPAFRFHRAVTPNEWQGELASSTKTPNSRSEGYRKFFQSLIDELREEHHFTAARIGQPQNWYSFGSGIAGLTYGASFAAGGRVRVELYIDRGSIEANKAIFDALLGQQGQIEGAFGAELKWERLEEKRASRIAFYFPGSIESSDEELALVQAEVVTKLLSLKAVLDQRLAKAVARADAPVSSH
jgi:hypothetical protein